MKQDNSGYEMENQTFGGTAWFSFTMISEMI